MPEYVIVRHTDHATFGYQVEDTETGERHGYGLTFADADVLRERLEERIGAGPRDGV